MKTRTNRDVSHEPQVTAASTTPVTGLGTGIWCSEYRIADVEATMNS
jgi:hypothetical protein